MSLGIHHRNSVSRALKRREGEVVGVDHHGRGRRVEEERILRLEVPVRARRVGRLFRVCVGIWALRALKPLCATYTLAPLGALSTQSPTVCALHFAVAVSGLWIRGSVLGFGVWVCGFGARF